MFTFLYLSLFALLGLQGRIWPLVEGMWLFGAYKMERQALNGPTSEMEHGPPNDSRGWSRLLQVTTGGFSFQITNTLTLPSILEKLFVK